MLSAFIFTILISLGSQDPDFPSQVSLHQCVVLDLSGSIQYDNKNLLYEWDFGDGSRGYGEVAEHCYDTLGSYTAILKITDPFTATNFRNEHVVEVNIVPAVSLSIQQNTSGDQCHLVADLQSVIPVQSVSFYWDVDGQYYVGNELDLKLPNNTPVRLVSRFDFQGNSEILSYSTTIQ